MIAAIDITADTPFGKKPPCCHRFRTLASGPAWPLASSQPPKPIIPTIAATLMIENQNSVSPYDFTLARLSRLIATKKTSADTQVGTPGHQYCT